MPLAAHCEAAGFQLTPPSAVSKTFVLPRFQMAAWNASVARTPPRSSSSGEWRRAQCEPASVVRRSEEHTSELQSRRDLVCRLLLEKKKKIVRRREDTRIAPNHAD